jgi:hypothetical protein
MTTILDLLKYEQLKWRYGGPRDFWLANLGHISKFIEKNKIAAVDKAHLVDNRILVDMEEASRPTHLPQPWIFGGLKCPHLHFKGEIFLLTDSQWKDFSSVATKQFQEKLANAKSVNFDQLMRLSEATADIG